MEKLVVATDFSEVARHAYAAGASLAKSYGAEILLVHEAELPPPLCFESMAAPIDLDRYTGLLREKLDDELRHPTFKDVSISPKLLGGQTAENNLIDFATSECCDLIVMSTHGRSGLAHSLVGSFTERVAQRSTVPVLTYRKPKEADRDFEPKSILLPFDLSENSQAAFPVVQLLGEAYDVDVTVLHVLPEVSVHGDWGDSQERLRISAKTAAVIEEKLRELVEQECPLFKVTVETRFGDPYREIIKQARARSADAIVLATHGRTGLKHFYFGSVAEKVLRSSPCSVLTVRPAKVQEEPAG